MNASRSCKFLLTIGDRRYGMTRSERDPLAAVVPSRTKIRIICPGRIPGERVEIRILPRRALPWENSVIVAYFRAGDKHKNISRPGKRACDTYSNSNAPRIPPTQSWMFGCLEGWRVEGRERNKWARLGWDGLGWTGLGTGLGTLG